MEVDGPEVVAERSPGWTAQHHGRTRVYEQGDGAREGVSPFRLRVAGRLIDTREGEMLIGRGRNCSAGAACRPMSREPTERRPYATSATCPS